MNGAEGTMGQAGGAAVLPASRARAYAQARRHSRRVRFLKRAIPLGALMAVGAVSAFVMLDPFGRVGNLELGPVSLSGTQVTMENPKLTGFRKDSRPYEVTASAAMQDVRRPNLVNLKDLKARLAMDDKGGIARLEAVSGLFDTQKEHLDLHQDVRVRTENGQDVRLKSAAIDFKAGTVVSREPVTVSLANGVIEAEGIEVSDNGKVMVFTGRVRTTFENPGPQGAAAPPTITGSAAPTGVDPAEPTGRRP